MLNDTQPYNANMLSIELLSKGSISASSALFFQSFQNKFMLLKKMTNTSLQSLINEIWRCQFNDQSEQQFVVKLEGKVVAAFGISYGEKQSKPKRITKSDAFRIIRQYGLLNYLKTKWICAMFEYIPPSDEAYISYIAVDENKRGKGIGKFILHWIKQYVKMNTEAKKISLYVAENNLEAKKLYEKFDFKNERYDKVIITKFSMGISGWHYMCFDL